MTTQLEQGLIIPDLEDYREAVKDFAAAPGEPGKLRDKNAGRDFRRMKSIIAYVGANGSGKSACAVHDCIPSLKAGRTVLSTVALIDPKTGEPYPSYVRLQDWNQLLEAEHCDVVFDEVTGIASSRTSQGMPVQVANLLNQLRRRDIVLRWTAPAWSRADVIIRECTQAVVVCRGYLPKTVKAEPGAPDVRAWRPKRLFRWSTYAAEDFATWSDSKEEKLSKLQGSWFWGPGSEAFASYNTLDSVERVGEVLDTGSCAHCGGHKARKKCECEKDDSHGMH